MLVCYTYEQYSDMFLVSPPFGSNRTPYSLYKNNLPYRSFVRPPGFGFTSRMRSSHSAGENLTFSHVSLCLNNISFRKLLVHPLRSFPNVPLLFDQPGHVLLFEILWTRNPNLATFVLAFRAKVKDEISRYKHFFSDELAVNNCVLYSVNSFHLWFIFYNFPYLIRFRCSQLSSSSRLTVNTNCFLMWHSLY